MKNMTQVRRHLMTGAASVSVLLIGMGFSQFASAGCGQYRPTSANETVDSSSAFLKTFFAADADTATNTASIVGLWHFKYVSEGNTNPAIPDGVIVDEGNTVWYADGNESTVSGMRSPATGDVCLGVWKQTGGFSYQLNHIGLSWDPVNNAPAGPAFIKQSVLLDRGGDAYTGTFDIRQLAADGKTLEVEIKGKIVARRVTVTTDTQT